MYKFDPAGDPPKTAFSSIAINQIDEALEDLDAPDNNQRSVVHEARRRTKMLRGLLRMVQPGFDAFESEDSALRAAANLLSHLRDREVLHETLEALGDWQRSALLERLIRVTEAAAPPDHSAALAEFRERLTNIRGRAQRWQLTPSGFETLVAGLRQTYRSARRHMTLARRLPTPDRFHDWRKSNKNHGFHIDLLRKAAPAVLDSHLEVVDEVSSILGQHHDLAVLRESAFAQRLPLDGPTELSELIALISGRVGELERDAFELGRQVYAESPRAIGRRISSYWRSARP